MLFMIAIFGYIFVLEDGHFYGNIEKKKQQQKLMNYHDEPQK
jgi:hypothetical protein